MLTQIPVAPDHWFCLAGTGEDPFLYKTKRGWHIIFHGMCPTGIFQAHYAFSTLEQDARNWTLSPRQTYSYETRFTNGTNITFARMERPQLAFNYSTGQPAYLINGVC